MRSGMLSLLVVCALALSAQAVTNSELLSNDIDVLNYALTLEHLEATFYNMYQAQYTSADFVSAGFTDQDYSYFDMIQSHENNHVSFLSSTIAALGGTPVQACTYNFGVNSVVEYVATARLLESTGVMAYDGGLKYIHKRSLQQGAATIATVEARHAEFLDTLNDKVPFPSHFDVAKSPEAIAKKIKGLIVSCPDQLTLPTLLNVPWSDARITFVNKSSISGAKLTNKVASANDIKTLNYALVLEHLEYTYYMQLLAMFSAADFKAAGYDADVRPYINLIMQDEQAHVNALTAALKAAGATPYPYCTYDFSSVTTLSQYLSLAATFEGVGVSAYDGAAHTISFEAYLQVAATIATVEGRHAGYLNMLSGGDPFPSAFDATRTPQQVASIVQSFQTCSFDIELPEILYISAIPKSG